VEEVAPPLAEVDNPRRKMVVADAADAPSCPQLAMLRVRGSLYFGAVDHVRERFRDVDERDPQRKWLLVAATGINFVDLAGARLLAEEAERRRALGGGLVLAGVQPAVRQMLQRAEALQAIGAERTLAHKGDALRTLYPLLDSAVCAACPRRIFHECRERLPDGTPRAAVQDPAPPSKADP
jgi:SulP family sulfate permease